MKKFYYLTLPLFLFFGCSDSHEVVPCCPSEPVILTFSNNVIAFPNAYTPNGNGLNETYQPFLNLDNPATIKSFEFVVLKNGEILYTENSRMSDFRFFEQRTELLQFQFEIITEKEEFSGSINFVSLASECFTIGSNYFLLDQFDENLLSYREFTSEIGCN